MDNFFEKNIAALSARVPAAGLLKNRLSEKVEVQTTPSGMATIKYDRLLIHSAYDPEKEGRTLARNVKPGSFVCLYGFGLGYHLLPILDRIGPEGFLLTIELNPEILAAAMILRDQSDLLSHNRFHLIFGVKEPEVASEISRYMRLFRDSPDRLEPQDGGGLEVLFHAPSFKCMPRHFTRIANALEILLMERRVPAVFGDLEDQNYALNKDVVARSPGIKSLRGKRANQPAVLVNAGPSLDDAIPYLRELQRMSLLACVDTSFPILCREGIAPDYVFSLDPQEVSFSYFADHIERPVRLIFTPTANAKIVRHCPGEKIVVFKEGRSLSNGNDPLMLEKGTTRSGGSVSCLGLDSLIQLGCNPIILAGQDCAFSGNRTYSRYSNYHEQTLQRVDGACTAAASHLDKTFERKRIAAPGYDGAQVFTDQVLYNYMRNIEQIAQTHPETKIYNLFAHGARIERV
ncbi:MAG: motility associated factor glycosyltransferase family protein, partial [Nitrospinales bacterium]